MKKLVFTALAVVAFSGISIAKNVDVEKNVANKEIESLLKLKEEDSDCYNRAMKIMDCLEVPPVEAHDIWQILTRNC